MHALNGNIIENDNYRDYLKINLSFYPIPSEISLDEQGTLLVLIARMNGTGTDISEAYNYNKRSKNYRAQIIANYINECGIKVSRYNINSKPQINDAKMIYSNEGGEWMHSILTNIELNDFSVNELYFLNNLNFRSGIQKLNLKLSVSDKHIKKNEEFYSYKLIWASLTNTYNFRLTIAETVLSIHKGKYTHKAKKYLKAFLYNQWAIDYDALNEMKQQWLDEHYIFTKVQNKHMITKWKKRLDKMEADIREGTNYFYNKIMHKQNSDYSSTDSYSVIKYILYRLPEFDKDYKWSFGDKQYDNKEKVHVSDVIEVYDSKSKIMDDNLYLNTKMISEENENKRLTIKNNQNEEIIRTQNDQIKELALQVNLLKQENDSLKKSLENNNQQKMIETYQNMINQMKIQYDILLEQNKNILKELNELKKGKEEEEDFSKYSNVGDYESEESDSEPEITTSASMLNLKNLSQGLRDKIRLQEENKLKQRKAEDAEIEKINNIDVAFKLDNKPVKIGDNTKSALLFIRNFDHKKLNNLPNSKDETESKAYKILNMLGVKFPISDDIILNIQLKDKTKTKVIIYEY